MRDTVLSLRWELQVLEKSGAIIRKYLSSREGQRNWQLKGKLVEREDQVIDHSVGTIQDLVDLEVIGSEERIQDIKRESIIGE